MMQAHYNIPGGSFNGILEGIISHLTPKGCTEYERIAEVKLKGPRKSLLDSSRGTRQAVFSWSMAGFIAIGLNLFEDPDTSKEYIVRLTNDRYRPPSSRYSCTDYLLMISGSEVDFGKYPLSFRMAESSVECRQNQDLVWFAKTAKEAGFDYAKTIMDEMKKRNKTNFTAPETEEKLKEMIEQDNLRVYYERLITDIQMVRFFWDFLGKPIETAGYLPECIEGGELNSSQPALKADLEMITAYPSAPAIGIAKKMIERMVGDFTAFGVNAALRVSKDLPDPEYKRPR